MTADCPYTLHWNAPTHGGTWTAMDLGGPREPQIRWVGALGPPESSTPTASRSVQPSLQRSLVWLTDHTTRSVTIDCMHVRSMGDVVW